jgi:beta-mannanase
MNMSVALSQIRSIERWRQTTRQPLRSKICHLVHGFHETLLNLRIGLAQPHDTSAHDCSWSKSQGASYQTVYRVGSAGTELGKP